MVFEGLVVFVLLFKGGLKMKKFIVWEDFFCDVIVMGIWLDDVRKKE